jgi:hypothetical protein
VLRVAYSLISAAPLRVRALRRFDSVEPGRNRIADIDQGATQRQPIPLEWPAPAISYTRVAARVVISAPMSPRMLSKLSARLSL